MKNTLNILILVLVALVAYGLTSLSVSLAKLEPPAALNSLVLMNLAGDVWTNRLETYVHARSTPIERATDWRIPVGWGQTWWRPAFPGPAYPYKRTLWTNTVNQ